MIEIPQGMKLTKFAKRILKRLEKKGLVIWQQDDSENGTVKQLAQIAEEVGYRLFEISRSPLEVQEQNASAVRVAGRFMMFDDHMKEIKQR